MVSCNVQCPHSSKFFDQWLALHTQSKHEINCFAHSHAIKKYTNESCPKVKQYDCRAQPPDNQIIAIVLTIIIITNHLELEAFAHTLLMPGALSNAALAMFARLSLQKQILSL
jgi:hypothetical protein